MAVLRVESISKQTGESFLLQETSFTQEQQQRIAIAGETGSGKSTLLKIIAGLLQADSGQVWFNDKRVLGPKEKLLPGHSSIGYLSQHFELRNNYQVTELLYMASKLPDNQAEIIFRVCQVDHLLKRKSDQLSGGEKQRIALAAVLVGRPSLLLLDEPFSNLDMIHKQTMKEVVHAIAGQLKITTILISHDPLDTLSWADEIIVMKDGRVVQHDKPYNIYNRPADEYTAGLFGSYNLLTLEQAGVFAQLPGISLNGMNMLIRPERIRFTITDIEAISGVVIGSRFYGSYYEVAVSIANGPVLVRSQFGLPNGVRVHIQVDPAGVWNY